MILLLPDESINDLQRRTIIKLVNQLTQAHEIDIIVESRKDGQNHRYEADWLKHLQFEPPQ